jgi:hypothetical protein
MTEIAVSFPEAPKIEEKVNEKFINAPSFFNVVV